MSWEPMSLATVAADELGADVATIRVTGLLEDDDYHLTGVDVLVAAGMAIAAAFCIGLVQGIIAETRQPDSPESGGLTDWGRGTGVKLVRRLRHFVNKFTKRGEAPPAETETETDAEVHDDADLTVQFTVLVATVRENLMEQHIGIRQLEVAAANSKGEVTAILMDLGVREGRASTLASQLTGALLDELAESMT